MNTWNSAGSVDLEKFSNGSGIWANEFFDPYFFDDLVKYQKIQNETEYNFKDDKILKEYDLELDTENLTSVFKNDTDNCIFTFKDNGYYFYCGFINNEFRVLEINDDSTDQNYYTFGDVKN